MYNLPLLGLFEERALLLGRLGRHDQALAIYVHVVKDDKMAEEYGLLKKQKLLFLF